MVLPFDGELHETWERYVASWSSPLRRLQKDRVAADLDLLLDQLRSAEPETRAAFVSWLLAEVLDRGVELPLQQPLLERVVAPHLARALTARQPREVLWLVLASKHRLLARIVGGVCTTGGVVSPHALLELGTQLAPDDPRPWTWLAEGCLVALSYAAHELPIGWVCELEEVAQLLDRLERVVAERPRLVPPSAPKALALYRRLYENWRRFEAEGRSGSFARWCAVRGEASSAR